MILRLGLKAMEERLAALRRQRASIAAHLAWLDAEITQCEQDAENLSAGSASSVDSPETPPHTTSSTPDSNLLAEPPSPPPSQGLGLRQKAGCVLFFILMLALALFLLWGLPAMLY